MVTLTIDAHNFVPIMGEGNHTYLIVDGASAALVDTGMGLPEHLSDVADALNRAGATLDQVVVTHGHSDHISGAPVFAAAYPRARFRKIPWPEVDSRYAVAWEPLADRDTIEVGGTRLQVLWTPGHAPDHAALWHEPTRTMWSGDLVLARGTVVIPPSRGGSLRQYLDSLARVLQLRPARLLPAHGAEMLDPERAVRRHVDHRHMREGQIVAALAGGGHTVPEITESIYHGLAEALVKVAHENVRAHLEKLAQEQRAHEHEGRWRLGPAGQATGATSP